MREININIEGYNVNGICVGCLNYNRKMYYSEKVVNCFKSLGDIDVPDGLTIQVCWECLAAARAVERFQRLILRSYDILIDYSRQHTFLNSPLDLSRHAQTRLSATGPRVEETGGEGGEGVEGGRQLGDAVVKEEAKDELDDCPEAEMVKSEVDTAEAFPEEEVSEDDVQLSRLKRKKERKKEKKKKREDRKSVKTKPVLEHHRKLKNLPPDLVELHTLTEQEMWAVRAEDLASEEFRALRYRCSDCIIGFSSEQLMKDHMLGKHSPKGPDARRCDVCRAYLVSRASLAAHRARHAAAYRCARCGSRTTLRRRAAAHARAHAPAARCRSCGEEFSSKSKLAYHRGVCCQQRPQCDCCGKVFANKMTLKYHLKVLPQNKQAKPQEKLNIPCVGCDKVFHSKKSYRAHVVIHDGQTHPCPVCNKLFQWKRNLARHMRNHRDREAGATQECRECGKTFSSRDSYNNHMKLSKRHVHEDAYVHECSYCGKKFASKWCMVDHIDWDHLKRIKYQCSVCFKAFKTAKIMVAHVNNIHEGRRGREPDGAHLCDVCGKSYKTVKRLKGHVWAMHTNRSTAKSFRCRLCPATFTWQTSIYKHMKVMHDNKRQKQARPPPKPEPLPTVEPRGYFPDALAAALLHDAP